jgi:hypothetical protein
VTFVPHLERSLGSGELRATTLGHPLLDDCLEFVGARGATNTGLATAYDLKVFFEVVGKEPAEVTTAAVFAFLAEQRKPLRGETVVRIEDGEAGLAARTIARRLSSLSGLYACDDLFYLRRIRRVAQPFVARRSAGVEAGHGRRRSTSTSAVEQILGHDPSFGARRRAQDRPIRARRPCPTVLSDAPLPLPARSSCRIRFAATAPYASKR